MARMVILQRIEHLQAGARSFLEEETSKFSYSEIAIREYEKGLINYIKVLPRKFDKRVPDSVFKKITDD